MLIFNFFFCKISILSYVLILLVTFKYLYSAKGCVRYYAARFLYYFGIFITTTLCIPFFLILSPGSIENAKLYSRYVGKYFSYFYGVTCTLKEGHHLSENKNGVIVANHQHHELDIIGTFNFWDAMGGTAAIAKRELFWSPWGFAAWLAGGVIFINREDPKTSHKTLNDTTSVLKQNTKIFVFPEGTKNLNLKKTKKLLPFKKGAFRIAIEAQVPIIPVLFSPYYFMDEERKILDLGGEILISVLPPVSTSGLTLKDLDRLIIDVQEKMENENQKLFKEVKENVIPKLESEEKKTRFFQRLEEAKEPIF